MATTDSIKTFALPDGSEITLSPHSSIAFSRHNMEKGKRIISLQGKSYFSIYHDPLHPFIVNSEIGMVKVLGTVFQIDESRKGIMYVYVESGKVSLSNRQGNGTVFLTKGMNAVLKKNSKAPIILATGNRNQTTWATGVFRFSNTPITEVLKEISAYYHINMTTNNTNKQLSGEFESHDINEIKKLIETTLCIKIKITQ